MQFYEIKSKNDFNHTKYRQNFIIHFKQDEPYKVSQSVFSKIIIIISWNKNIIKRHLQIEFSNKITIKLKMIIYKESLSYDIYRLTLVTKLQLN